MRRPQAVGLRAVMLGLLVVFSLPAAVVHAGRPVGHGPIRTPARQVTADAYVLARTATEAVNAGTTDEACTGWRSTLYPPPTIRVLRTRGPEAGKVYRDPADPTGMTPLEIPFRDYVGITMAGEWPASYPLEVLKVGAIAVKQYAWYYTIVYRGGVDKDGFCYDVEDDTTDQWYQPGSKVPQASQLKAIAATWPIHLRKTERATTGRGRFILTGYRAGKAVPCGTDTDHFRLYQHSAYDCGKLGMNMEQVLRTYMDPRLEIVTPGRHDIVGDAAAPVTAQAGDISAVVDTPSGGLVPHLWATARTGIAGADATTIDLSGPGLMGFASADATTDGWDDLVIARSTGATSVRLAVARSDGAGYLDPTTWWSGDVGADLDRARLLVGDWTGDQKDDAALLLRGPKGAAELKVFPHKKGKGYDAPVTWWTGLLDPDRTSVAAGDLNGDGRHDLLVTTDLGDGGRRYEVAYSRATAPRVMGLGSLKQRLVAPDLVGDVVKQAVGDVTRDGREDVVLLIDDGTRTRVDVLRATGGGKPFARSEAWRSTADGRLPFGKLKPAMSDLDADGLMDLVVFRDRGDAGTEILSFVTPRDARYGTFAAGDSITDDVEWKGLRPY